MTLLEELMVNLTSQKNQITNYKASVNTILTSCCTKKDALESVSGPSDLVLKMISECSHEETVLTTILQERTDIETSIDGILALSSGDQVILGEILNLLVDMPSLLENVQNALINSGFDRLKTEYQTCVAGAIPSDVTIMILQSCITSMLN